MFGGQLGALGPLRSGLFDDRQDMKFSQVLVVSLTIGVQLASQSSISRKTSRRSQHARPQAAMVPFHRAKERLRRGGGTNTDFSTVFAHFRLTTRDQLRKHLTVGGLNVAGEAFGVVWAQNADQPHLPT